MIAEEKIKQPAMCTGCVWGRWDGHIQFCGLPECVKEKEPNGVASVEKVVVET